MSVHINISDSKAIEALPDLLKQLKERGLRPTDVRGELKTIDDKVMYLEERKYK